MKIKSLLTFYTILFTCYAVNAQVNKSYESHKGVVVKVPQGQISFADSVVSFNPGKPWKSSSRARDPKLVLGEPDVNKNVMPRPDLSLGCGGQLTVMFTDNALINSTGSDIYIFEVGEKNEPILVEISKNGTDWITVGKNRGGSSSINIAPVVKAGEEFYFVRLTDLKTCCKSNNTCNVEDDSYDGADIDAIAAIGSIPKVNKFTKAKKPKPKPESDNEEVEENEEKAEVFKAKTKNNFEEKNADETNMHSKKDEFCGNNVTESLEERFRKLNEKYVGKDLEAEKIEVSKKKIEKVEIKSKTNIDSVEITRLEQQLEELYNDNKDFSEILEDDNEKVEESNYSENQINDSEQNNVEKDDLKNLDLKNDLGKAELIIWDGQQEDNDAVSIYLNDIKIIDNIIVTNLPKTFIVDLIKGENKLEMVVESCGKTGDSSANFKILSEKNNQSTYLKGRKGDRKTVYVVF